jgi:hypothetical protein
MLTFLRSRTRGQLIAIAVAVLAVGATFVAILAIGRGGAHRPVVDRTPVRPSSSIRTPPEWTLSPTTAPSTSDPLARVLPTTASADVYATAVAEALWDIDYATTSRDAVLAFWRAQLSPVLPAGTPTGTTLAQAQAAAMSTISDYLPSDAMWSTLAHDRTASSFTVTGVSEPPSWIEAISSGEIADPGLTAREVIGIQKITYGTGVARRTTTQTQQLIVSTLCPPTTAACTVEIFPPRGDLGVTG